MVLIYASFTSLSKFGFIRNNCNNKVDHLYNSKLWLCLVFNFLQFQNFLPQLVFSFISGGGNSVSKKLCVQEGKFIKKRIILCIKYSCHAYGKSKLNCNENECKRFVFFILMASSSNATCNFKSSGSRESRDECDLSNENNVKQRDDETL